MSDLVATNRKYLVFFIVAVTLFTTSTSMSMMIVALPVMAEALQTDLNWLGWTLTAYQLAQGAVMPLAGRISDDFGRRRVFIACIAVFTAGSLMSAFAPNVYWLIVFRVVQAIGGGSILPAASGIVSDEFKEKRTAALGLFTSIFPLGGVIGPTLGGWIVDSYSWREIFLVNAPVGVLVMLMAFVLLRPDPARAAYAPKRSIDFGGALLFSGSILGIMYALTMLGKGAGGADLIVVGASFAAGVALAFALVRYENHVAEPALDMALMRTRPFLITNVFNMLYGACVFGFFAFIPLYAVQVYGMSVLDSGTLLAPRGLGMIIMSTIFAFILQRTGYRLPIYIGMGCIGAGLLLLAGEFHDVSLFGYGISDFHFLMVAVTLTGFGAGMASPAANNAAIELMPTKVAAITGLRGMFRSTGGVLGTAAIILLLSLVPDPAAGFRYMFLAVTGGLVLMLPLVMGIPDGAPRGRKAQAAAEAVEAATSEVATAGSGAGGRR
ncbi:MAG: MFS transporter [Chloroflexi bacterium]|nr:MFS transporter [Chloroflexota bacterium]